MNAANDRNAATASAATMLGSVGVNLCSGSVQQESQKRKTWFYGSNFRKVRSIDGGGGGGRGVSDSIIIVVVVFSLKSYM